MIDPLHKDRLMNKTSEIQDLTVTFKDRLNTKCIGIDDLIKVVDELFDVLTQINRRLHKKIWIADEMVEESVIDTFKALGGKVIDEHEAD